MIRPLMVFVTVWLMFVSLRLCGKYISDDVVRSTTIISAFGTILIMSMNGIHDLLHDIKKGRTFVHRHLTVAMAIATGALMIIINVIIHNDHNLGVMIYGIILIIIATHYYLSYLFRFSSALLVGMSAALVVIVGAEIGGNITFMHIIIAGMSVVLLFARECLKDIEDYAIDKQSGVVFFIMENTPYKKTIPVTCGIEITKWFIFGALVTSVLIGLSARTHYPLFSLICAFTISISILADLAYKKTAIDFAFFSMLLYLSFI